MGQRRLKHLSGDEAFALLRSEEVGRLIFVDDVGPVAIPVNYVVEGGKVVFRIEHGPKEAALGDVLAFEVDQIRRSDHTGWSVLVRGTARELPMEQVVELLHRVRSGFPRPWAEGVHSVWMALVPTEVTGRRLDTTVDEG